MNQKRVSRRRRTTRRIGKRRALRASGEGAGMDDESALRSEDAEAEQEVEDEVVEGEDLEDGALSDRDSQDFEEDSEPEDGDELPDAAEEPEDSRVTLSRRPRSDRVTPVGEGDLAEQDDDEERVSTLPRIEAVDLDATEQDTRRATPRREGRPGNGVRVDEGEEPDTNPRIRKPSVAGSSVVMLAPARVISDLPPAPSPQRATVSTRASHPSPAIDERREHAPANRGIERGDQIAEARAEHTVDKPATSPVPPPPPNARAAVAPPAPESVPSPPAPESSAAPSEAQGERVEALAATDVNDVTEADAERAPEPAELEELVEVDETDEAQAREPESRASRTPPPPPPGARGKKPPPPPRGQDDGREKQRRVRQWWERFFSDDYLMSVLPPNNAQVKRQVDFIESSLGLGKGATVLDVGCGLGLHALELSRRGYLTVGLDLSLTMITRAAEEAQHRNLKINFLHADIREIEFDGTFDGVICMGTTFGFFDDDANRDVLARLYQALKPGGRILLDVVNRDYVIGCQPNLVWFEGDECVCMEESDFNYFSSRLKVKRTMMGEDGRQSEAEYSIRLYSLHELGLLMQQMGFRVLEVSGQEATRGTFFGAHSQRILMLGERRVPGRKSIVHPEINGSDGSKGSS